MKPKPESMFKKQVETLSKISETIVSEKYLQEMLNLIVVMTAQMMNSKICSIMLLDEQKKELFIVATQSLSQEYRDKPPIKVGESVSGRVVHTNEPIMVPDVRKEPGYMYPQMAKKEGIASMLSVPMRLKNRVIGVINSYTSHVHKFTKDEVKVLQSVANQAAIAIENTKLLEESLKVKESLENRKVLDRAKGILMDEMKLSENDAYKSIQRKSMDTGRPMKEIAEAIITAWEIKKYGLLK